MSFDELLGRTVKLPVLRITSPGAYLETLEAGAGADADAEPSQPILLPTRELPDHTKEGDELDVFIYLDSEDRPIATTTAPKLQLGEVRFLKVTDTTRFGAFVDWGLPKELLVPFSEQTSELQPGDLHPIGLTLDRTGRLAGTMRIREMLLVGGAFERDEWVLAEAWREERGIGVFCIIEGKYLGLLSASEPHALRRGQSAEFRVQNVLPDGKIELSLRGRVHEELETDAQNVLTRLGRAGAPRVGDHSSPEQIRALFGLSKKAFKRAAGRLLRDGLVLIDREGFLTVSTQRDHDKR
jgi:predicted RNA-binding protein (virulence factor B family)